jgi:general secretion pathway protein D
MQLVKKTVLLLCILSLVAGCSAGRTALNKAERLERQGQLDEAVMKYAEAAAASPEVGEYRLRLLKATDKAARNHVKIGDDLFADKNYDEALREYQAAYALDPSIEKAKQQSELVVKLRNSLVFFQEGVRFEKENKAKEAVRSYQKALSINPENKSAAESLERILKSKKTKLDGFELNLKSTKPITLKFKDAKIKEVFNIITQLSGINFVFDEAVKDSNVSIYLENATFQQALDIITGINKLGKKPLNEGTIIIFPKTPEKVKQYEELFVQTFFLNKLDAKKAVNLIRTMLQVKKIYVNEEMNALVLRDTPDVLDVARKILEANDVPDAEVLLEVEVIELAKNNAENFGLALSRYAVQAAASNTGTLLSDTLVQPTSNPAGGGASATAATTTNLLNLFRWRGFDGFITVPNATFNFSKSLANGETLSNPKIRVKNREKSKFNVGTRVPITTTSTNGNVGGVNVNVQYVDVGVKVSAEPIIQLNNDINIKLSLEVSSILQKDKIGDGTTTVVTIGTRNLDTVLSLRDGETSIIGGLIQDIKNTSKNKIFLLGDVPLLGDLFSNKDNSNQKTELVLAITPRIVRGVTIPDPEVAAFWSGVEDDPSTIKAYSSFAQEPEYATLKPSPQTAPAPAATAPIATPPAPTAAAPVATPPAPNAAAPATPVATPIAPAAPGQTSALPAQQPAQQVVAPIPPQPVPGKRIALNVAAPASVKLNEQFTVDVVANEADNLYGAPFTLVYDPIFLDFVGAAEGDLLKKDNTATVFATKVDKSGGQITVSLSRSGDVAGVKGTGKLLSATFRAKSQGPASVGFTGVKFVASNGKQLDVIPYNAVIEVKQP